MKRKSGKLKLTHRLLEKQQSIDDFSEVEWEKVLISLAEEAATEYTIKTEIWSETSKGKHTRKRPPEVLP